MGMKVIPSGSSAVVTDKHDHHGDWDQGRGQRGKEILREQAAGFREGVASRERYEVANAQRHTDTLGGVKDARYDIVDAVTRVGTAGALASCKTDDGVAGGFAAAQRDLCDSTKDITASGRHGFEEVRHDICHLNERSSDAFGIASVQAEKNTAALGVSIQTNTAALQVQSDKNAAALGLQATTFASQASVQAQNFSNLGNVQAERIRSELGMLSATGFQAASVQVERIAAAASLEATKFADAALLRAEQIANNAARQAAECCCELKEKMAAQETDRMRVELADAKLDAKLYRFCDSRDGRDGRSIIRG